jgi:prepilin-type N-terminal cleavage/methylation domain-containing protein
MPREPRRGFTLIELSIVLVIIGLIAGGVLVGQELITAAAIRAQISQIEKYNTAVNTFRGKYDNYLPGDITSTEAAQFGLTARTGALGQGDGNGLITGPTGINPPPDVKQGGGETGLFWVDLSAASLIDGSFSTATATSIPSMTATTVGLYMPAAKLGQGNFIYVYTDGSVNWFGFSGVSSTASPGNINGTANITVMQAFKIDSKIDDGFPASGNVISQYLFCPGRGGCGMDSITVTKADSPAASGNGDCYDNTTTQGAYAVWIDNGMDVTCALSFKFQ